MFDKLKLLKQAKELQSKMQGIIITEESNGIKITINGKLDILNLEIIQDDLMENKTKLEFSIRQAVNAAVSRAQRESAMSMQSELGGLF